MPPFQPKCSFCHSNDFEDNKDSRAGISSNTHIKYKNIINEYIIFVQDYNDTIETISLKVFKFLSSNTYFDTYIKNQYDRGSKKTCNFIPYSYDWILSGPISIMNVDINISRDEPEIIYHLYNPDSEIHDDIPESILDNILYSNEKDKLSDKTKITNGYFKYDYIKDIFKLRTKNHGKPRGNTSRK